MHPTSYWFDYVSDKFGEHLSESQVEPYLAQATFNGMSSFVEQLSGYGMRHLNRVSDLTLFDIVANYSRTVMGRPLAPEVAARLKYRFGSASDKPITNPAPVINKIKVSGDPRLGNTLSCNISMEKQEQERERERERDSVDEMTFCYSWTKHSDGTLLKQDISASPTSEYTLSEPHLIGNRICVEVVAKTASSRPSAEKTAISGLVRHPILTSTVINPLELAGNPEIGNALTAQITGFSTHPNTTYQFTWARLSDGQIVHQESTPSPASTYRITAADANTRIKLTVVVQADGYEHSKPLLAQSPKIPAPDITMGTITISDCPKIGEPITVKASGFSAPHDPGDLALIYDYVWTRTSDQAEVYHQTTTEPTSTFTPTAAEAYTKLRIRLTVSAPGYRPAKPKAITTEIVEPQ